MSKTQKQILNELGLKKLSEPKKPNKPSKPVKPKKSYIEVVELPLEDGSLVSELPQNGIINIKWDYDRDYCEFFVKETRVVFLTDEEFDKQMNLYQIKLDKYNERMAMFKENMKAYLEELNAYNEQERLIREYEEREELERLKKKYEQT